MRSFSHYLHYRHMTIDITPSIVSGKDAERQKKKKKKKKERRRKNKQKKTTTAEDITRRGRPLLIKHPN